MSAGEDPRSPAAHVGPLRRLSAAMVSPEARETFEQLLARLDGR